VPGHGGSAITVALYGSGLLLTGELAQWSLDERTPERVLAGASAPRLVAMLAVAVAAGVRRGLRLGPGGAREGARRAASA
jgi:hypothetical protein